jgi:hypothetical protein
MREWETGRERSLANTGKTSIVAAALRRLRVMACSRMVLRSTPPSTIKFVPGTLAGRTSLNADGDPLNAGDDSSRLTLTVFS